MDLKPGRLAVFGTACSNSSLWALYALCMHSVHTFWSYTLFMHSKFAFCVYLSLEDTSAPDGGNVVVSI